MLATPISYLQPLVADLMKTWPDNRTINIACHGHSVPAGYFATPFVDSFNAYPHLLHRKLKERFPFAVVNVIVTAKGGESSDQGEARFASDVLGFKPDLITFDYALNDRQVGLFSSEKAHRAMIEAALENGAKVILMSPSADKRCLYEQDERRKLDGISAQLKNLADDYNLAFEDVLAQFDAYQVQGKLDELMSWPNHPNAQGHELIASALFKWFSIPPFGV